MLLWSIRYSERHAEQSQLLDDPCSIEGPELEDG